MAPNGINKDTPRPIISPPNSVTLQQLTVGCKVMVEREGDVPRKAEILVLRERQKTRDQRKRDRQILADNGKVEAIPEDERLEYYAHYVEFNKRLDEWVPGKRILLSEPVEWPQPTPANSHAGTPKKKTVGGDRTPGNLLKLAVTKAAAQANNAGNGGGGRSGGAGGAASAANGTNGHASTPDAMDVDEATDSAESRDPAETADPPDSPEAADTLSKTDEIEKLRTQGSMSQSHSEVARVKNLDKIQMGAYEVEAWYFSPYPAQYAYSPVLYICEFCLSFFNSEKMIERHREKCTLLHPPGNEIYRHEDISFFEIDGRRQRTWCRNLCLLCKCFLDHKTLYYDVDPFLFYVMCVRDSAGVHMVGYFSKEKDSAENYNLACILTLPQHQQRGYGKLLIEFSYELSRIEGKIGSPEKPLSDLGLLSYRAYWSEVIVDVLVNANDDVSIDDISAKTSFTHQDILNTVHVLQILRYTKSGYQFMLTDEMIAKHEKMQKKARRRINPEKIIWKPPVFSRTERLNLRLF